MEVGDGILINWEEKCSQGERVRTGELLENRPVQGHVKGRCLGTLPFPFLSPSLQDNREVLEDPTPDPGFLSAFSFLLFPCFVTFCLGIGSSASALVLMR